MDAEYERRAEQAPCRKCGRLPAHPLTNGWCVFDPVEGLTLCRECADSVPAATRRLRKALAAAAVAHAKRKNAEHE